MVAGRPEKGKRTKKNYGERRELFLTIFRKALIWVVKHRRF
jgi:hypothetical protein